MDVSSPRFGQSLSNAVNHHWLAAAGEEVPQPIPEPTAKPANACPVSVETLVRRSPTSGGEAGAAVVATVRAYDSTTVTMSDTLPIKQAIRNTAINWSGVAFRWQKWWWFCVTTGAVLVAMAAFTTSEWKLARQLYAATSNQTSRGFCLWHVCGFGAFSKCRWRVSNIMRVTVIFVAARSWGLAIILSSGSVSAVPSIHECSGFCSVTSKH